MATVAASIMVNGLGSEAIVPIGLGSWVGSGLGQIAALDEGPLLMDLNWDNPRFPCRVFHTYLPSSHLSFSHLARIRSSRSVNMTWCFDFINSRVIITLFNLQSIPKTLIVQSGVCRFRLAHLSQRGLDESLKLFNFCLQFLHASRTWQHLSRKAPLQPNSGFNLQRTFIRCRRSLQLTEQRNRYPYLRPSRSTRLLWSWWRRQVGARNASSGKQPVEIHIQRVGKLCNELRTRNRFSRLISGNLGSRHRSRFCEQLLRPSALGSRPD